MAAALQLAQDAFTRHLALEMLDGSLDALISNLDFERFALNGFAGIRQGTGDMADLFADCKHLQPNSANPTPEMTDQPRTRPTGVKAPHGAKELEIAWADGHRSRFPHEILRGYCPCAGCQGHSGIIQFQEGGNLELRNLEQVGNYALGLSWGDGHDTGIYTFRYLRALGDLLDAQGAEGVKGMGTLPRI